MRLKAAATTLTLLLALPTLPSFGEKVDLRGPAPKAGETTVMTIKTETDPGDMSMNVQGQALQGQMETEATHVIEQTILEVEDGEPTKVKSEFIEFKSITNTTMFGQTQEQEDTSMKGAILTQSKTADGWSTEVEGAQIPQEAKDMIRTAGYVNPHMVFPEKPVGVGDTWEIADEMMQLFMGQTGIPGAEFDGDMSFEMVGLEEIDGKLIAELHYEMDGTISMNLSPDPDTTVDLTIKMKGDGTVYRNVTDYTTAQDFEGKMDMNMKMTAGGLQAMTMTAEMPMKVEQTQERKE